MLPLHAVARGLDQRLFEKSFTKHFFMIDVMNQNRLPREHPSISNRHNSGHLSTGGNDNSGTYQS